MYTRDYMLDIITNDQINIKELKLFLGDAGIIEKKEDGDGVFVFVDELEFRGKVIRWLNDSPEIHNYMVKIFNMKDFTEKTLDINKAT